MICPVSSEASDRQSDFVCKPHMGTCDWSIYPNDEATKHPPGKATSESKECFAYLGHERFEVSKSTNNGVFLVASSPRVCSTSETPGTVSQDLGKLHEKKTPRECVCSVTPTDVQYQ